MAIEVGTEYRAVPRFLLGSFATQKVHTLSIIVFDRNAENEQRIDTLRGTDFRFTYPYYGTDVEVTAINPEGNSPIMLVYSTHAMQNYRVD